MTRAEAIGYLLGEYVVVHDGNEYEKELNEAIDMAIEALSAEAVQGVGRYENAMQKLREMPKYLNGVKAKQIKKIPSEAVQGWIPCSERLPDVGRDVIFCDAEWTEEGCLRADGDWWQFRWSTIIPKVEVIAWMPLPKPYREDGEE